MHNRRATVTAAERRAIATIRNVPSGIRHPKDLPPEQAALADRAMERIIDVMEERVPEKKQKGVLSAAAMIREEILGPQTQKVNVEGNLEHILMASMAQDRDPEHALLANAVPELMSGTP